MNISVAVKDNINVDLREGLVVRLTSGGLCAPSALFRMTLFCSVFLEGKPVHCSGLLPGVSLLVHAQIAGMDEQQRLAFVERGWGQVRSQLDQWVELADQWPCMNAAFDGGRVTIALDSQIKLDKGVMQIIAAPAWRGTGDEPPVLIGIPAPSLKLATSLPHSYKWRRPS